MRNVYFCFLEILIVNSVISVTAADSYTASSDHEKNCPSVKFNYHQYNCYNQTQCHMDNCLLNIITCSKSDIHSKSLKIVECVLGNKSLSHSKFSDGVYELLSSSVHTISKAFPENLLENFPNLKNLSVEGNELSEIGYIFHNNPKLQILYLSRNNLTKLPNDVFKNLSDLKILDLWKNKLVKIEETYFKGLRLLKLLELSDNRIRQIDENAFSDLNDLEHIKLRSNQLGNINSNIFKYNRKLQTIWINENPQLKIPDYVFSNLTHLKELKLDKSHLENVLEHTFENCTNLLTLQLQNNNLKILLPNLFKTLKKLKSLNLSNNKLESVPDSVFSPLENIDDLRLDGNQFLTITDKIFCSLSKLTKLNLKNNKIVNIEHASLSHLSNLVKLDLSYNLLNENSFDIFSDLTVIEEVNLSHNKLSFSLEKPLQSAGKLKKLDLSYNFWTEIEIRSLVKKSSHNVTIDLSHNNISRIDFSSMSIVQQNTDFIAVNLSNNPLICDCHNYELIEYLTEQSKSYISFNLSDTKCFGPKYLQNMLIRELSLSQIMCEIQNVHDCPLNCKCIRRPYDDMVLVNCSNRLLTHLPTLSLKQPKLDINMAGNLFERGPKKGEGYETVINLDLSNNKLSSFDWCPPRIEKLNLSYNKLKMLNSNVIKALAKSNNFSQLLMGNNPWTCSCSAFELQSFLKFNYNKTDSHNVLCEDDTLPIVEKDMCISDQTKYFRITIPILSILLIIAITITFYLKYKKEIKIWLHSKNCCLWFVTEEELDEDKKYDIFLSFSHKDEDFVFQNLVPSLEKSFTLCIHSRDWIPGELIDDHIVHSIYNSRRTLVILSDNFLESFWGKKEFLLAHNHSMKEGRPRVIVVKLGNLDMDKMIDDIKAYIKTFTYIEWGEPWFWKKLNYALPHSAKNIAKTNRTKKLKIPGTFQVELDPFSICDNISAITANKKHLFNFDVSASIYNSESEAPLII